MENGGKGGKAILERKREFSLFSSLGFTRRALFVTFYVLLLRYTNSVAARHMWRRIRKMNSATFFLMVSKGKGMGGK